MKLIIGNKNYSSWSMRAWLLLRHFAIEFEEVRIPLFTNNFQVTLAQYTDANKVPVLHDGDRNIWDSLAICEYISEQYLQDRGWPQKITARAEARSASAEMHSSFFQIRENLPFNCRARRLISFSDEVKSEISRVDALWQSLRTKYQQDGVWLFGQFSIADCMYAPMASRFRTYGADISETSQCYVNTILNHPQVKTWYEQARYEKEIIDWAEVGQDKINYSE